MNAGKYALITGGIRGIGLEIAKALLRTNLQKLCLVDIVEHNITLEMLRHDFPGKTIIYHKCDVSKKQDIDESYKMILKEFQRLDIVVNNAGILNDKDCELTLLTNLCGVINSSLLGMNYMSTANGGRGGYIINVSATAGLGPTYFAPVYTSSKAGVVGFTRCMGYNDYYYKKTGVKFIVVCPGITLTNMNDSIEDKLFLKEFKEVFDREVVAKDQYQDVAKSGTCVLRAQESNINGAVFICDNDQIKQQELTEFTQEFVSKDLKS